MSAPRPRRAEWLVVLVCGLAFASELQARWDPVVREPGATLSLETAGWLVGDCVTYRSIVRGIVDEHTLDQSITAWDKHRYDVGSQMEVNHSKSNVALTVWGELVPKHPVLFAAALAPAYLVAREWGLLAFNVLQCALLVLIVFWLARLEFGERAALVAAFGFLAGGIIRTYCYNVSPDCFGAVLGLGGLVLVWTPAASPRRLVVGGALMGLALWMRVTNLVVLMGLLPALADSWRGRRMLSRLALPALGFTVTAAGYLLLNAWWFGSPFVTSYDRVLLMHHGVRALDSARDHMNRDFWAGLTETLFDSAHGLLQTAPHFPLLLLGIGTMALSAGGRWRAAALLAITFAPVLFLVRYDFWDASSYGNRFFLLPAAASAVGIAWAAARIEQPPVARPEWARIPTEFR